MLGPRDTMVTKASHVLSTRSLKSSGENRHKQEKKKTQVNTNFSKCHEESKLKAVWRMDYRGKWLKIRNVL